MKTNEQLAKAISKIIKESMEDLNSDDSILNGGIIEIDDRIFDLNYKLEKLIKQLIKNRKNSYFNDKKDPYFVFEGEKYGFKHKNLQNLVNITNSKNEGGKYNGMLYGYGTSYQLQMSFLSKTINNLSKVVKPSEKKISDSTILKLIKVWQKSMNNQVIK